MGRRQFEAYLVAMLMFLAGPSYGLGQADRCQSASAGEARALAGNHTDQKDSGQIDQRSVLARKIKHSAKIRVWTPSGEKVMLRPTLLPEGLVTTKPGILRKNRYEVSTLIPWRDVREIQVQKSAALVGALVGLGVGGLAGLYAGQELIWEKYPAAYFIVPGAALGGLSGALLGAMTRRWKTVYAASAEPRSSFHISLAPIRRGGLMITVSCSR